MQSFICPAISIHSPILFYVWGYIYTHYQESESFLGSASDSIDSVAFEMTERRKNIAMLYPFLHTLWHCWDVPAIVSVCILLQTPNTFRGTDEKKQNCYLLISVCFSFYTQFNVLPIRVFFFYALSVVQKLSTQPPTTIATADSNSHRTSRCICTKRKRKMWIEHVCVEEFYFIVTFPCHLLSHLDAISVRHIFWFFTSSLQCRCSLWFIHSNPILS